jgi:thioredoxin-like negative regulator of GroEL
LDRETYTDAKVVGLAKKFIPVKLDCEKAEPQKVAAKYKVEAVPTIAFINADGKQVHSFVGFKPSTDFMAEMNKALKKPESKPDAK